MTENLGSCARRVKRRQTRAVLSGQYSSSLLFHHRVDRPVLAFLPLPSVRIASRPILCSLLNSVPAFSKLIR